MFAGIFPPQPVEKTVDSVENLCTPVGFITAVVTVYVNLCSVATILSQPQSLSLQNALVIIRRGDCRIARPLRCHREEGRSPDVAISCCGVTPGDCHGPYGPRNDKENLPLGNAAERSEFAIK